MPLLPNATKADLDEFEDRIFTEMHQGFAGVHARQDITNGRVGKMEVEQGRQDERVRNIDRVVFGRRSVDLVVTSPDVDAQRTAITRRDVTIFVSTVIAAVAVLKFLAWLLPALKGMTP